MLIQKPFIVTTIDKVALVIGQYFKKCFHNSIIIV